MQKRLGQLGEIFVNLGLITQDDVDKALAHQRQVGGYFGDALVQLGLLTPDQVRWGLADQYDIPFVRIHPENIDRATALAVPAAWAREHLMLPVLRDGDTVTVIMADPGKTDRIEEVRRFTRAARIDAALSGVATLRDLIDSVHGEGNGPPIQFSRWLGEVLASGATAVGISVRGERVRAWSRREEISVRKLEHGWSEELVRAISPFPAGRGDRIRSWPAVLSANGSSWCVECHAVGGDRMLEWTARIDTPLPHEFPRLRVDEEVLAAVTRGMRDGGIVVRVLGTDAVDPSTLEVLVAALPASLCGADRRSLHVADRPVAVPQEVLLVPIDESTESTVGRLGVYALDALSLDLDTLDSPALDAARRMAPVVIFQTRSEETDTLRADLEIRLRSSGEDLFWTSHSSDDAAN